jgi:hypothetical protein
MVFQHYDGAFILFRWSLLERYTFDSPNCVGITLKPPQTPLSHIVVELQVPPYSHFTLMVLLYWPSLSSTLLGVDSLQTLSF